MAKLDVRTGGTAALRAWALYDAATSPFFAVVLTFVIGTYFVRAVAPDPVAGTAAWGKMIALAALVTALAAPVFGAAANRPGARKPWLGALTLVAALASGGLWWVRPEPGWLVAGLILVGTAAVAMELAQVFYNAMLPDLAPPDRLGRWSGWGWGLGYAAGLVVLLLLLLTFIQADPPPFGLDRATAEPVRISGPVVAAWLILLTLPLLLVRQPPAPAAATIPLSFAKQLRALRQLARERPAIARFLLARTLYNDGLTTLFAFGGIYAAGTFAMTTSEVIQLGVALNATAALGALALAGADDRLGSRRVILLALAVLLVAGSVALLTTDRRLFWAAALLLGAGIGPAQAASRTLMARLAPLEHQGDLFGLFALTGRVTAFLGPLLFALASEAAGSQRAGMATTLAMLLLGGGLLLRVREPPRAQEGANVHRSLRNTG